MNKIDMSNKFFHGIEWDSDNINHKLYTLKCILESGYILGPKSQGIISSYGFGDKIFLSVYPKGEYSNIYTGNGKAETSGYEMSSNSFYFILDSKLKDDYEIVAGNYPLECTVNSKIDLYKYLVGIGNVGCNIDYRIIVCYYITKYMNNEIDIEELFNKLGDVFILSDITTIIKEINMFLNRYVYDEGHYLYYATMTDEKDLISYDNYYAIKEVIDEMKLDIKFYNDAGYLIDDNKELNKLRMMRKKIIDSNFSENDYGDCARKLYSRVKK